MPDAKAAAVVELSDDEAHHLRHVLRLGVGDEVSVFDGAGHEWMARVEAVKKRGVAVQLGAPVQPASEPPVRVTLAVGILKGDQMDGVVRDATMLGAAAIVPLVSDHVTVPSRVWQGERALDRWRRVAVASAKQCGRAVVPAIGPVVAYDRALDMPVDLRVCCVEPAHASAGAIQPAGLPLPASALVLVGPEGGWSAAEIERALRAGAEVLHLGPRTLRAETAPTVVLSALWTAWGW